MLVLTRKPEESFLLGEDIKVTVLSIKGNQVQFGVKAPSHVPIYRWEIYERIKSENISSVCISAEDFSRLKEEVK